MQVTIKKQETGATGKTSVARVRSKETKNKTYSCSSVYFNVVIGKENVDLIGFNPITFDIKNLQIKRPSIDTKKTIAITGGNTFRLSNIDESLIGTYELEKEDEDTFNLVRI